MRNIIGANPITLQSISTDPLAKNLHKVYHYKEIKLSTIFTYVNVSKDTFKNPKPTNPLFYLSQKTNDVHNLDEVNIK